MTDDRQLSSVWRSMIFLGFAQGLGRLEQRARRRADRKSSRPVRPTGHEWDEVRGAVARFNDYLEAQERDKREQDDERLLSEAKRDWYFRSDHEPIFRAALKDPETREAAIKLLTPPPASPEQADPSAYPHEWLAPGEVAGQQPARNNVGRTRIHGEDT
jgi:hypothetical protein